MNPFSFNQDLYEERYPDPRPSSSSSSSMRKTLVKIFLTKLSPKSVAIVLGCTIAAGLAHKGIVAFTKRRGSARRSQESSRGALNAVVEEEETANRLTVQDTTAVPARKRNGSRIASEGCLIESAANDASRSLSCLQNVQLGVGQRRVKVKKEAGLQTIPLHEEIEQRIPAAKNAAHLAVEPMNDGQYVGNPPISHYLVQHHQQAQMSLLHRDGKAAPPFTHGGRFCHGSMFNPAYGPRSLLPDLHNFLAWSHYERYDPVPLTPEDYQGNITSVNARVDAFFPHPAHTNPYDDGILEGFFEMHGNTARLQGTMGHNAQLIQEERASSPLARCDAPLSSPQPAVKKPLNPSTPPFVPRKGNESAVKQAFCTVGKRALNPCSPPFEPEKTEVNAVVSVNQEAS